MSDSASAIYLLPLLAGIVAGLRAMMAPAAVGLAAYFGRLGLAGTPLAFLGNMWVAGILTLLASIELIADQLPSTPSRKVPVQFGARLLTGGLSGAALGAASGSLVSGLIAGVIGAVIGTLGGAAVRGRLAAMFGKDLPAALIEDFVAIALAAFVVLARP